MSELEAYADAAARLNGLELSVASRAAVVQNFAVLMRMAQAFAETPLAPDSEPAPVYRL